MELIKLLPDYYEKNVTMQTLQGLLSEVTNELENGLSSTISECFVSRQCHEFCLGMNSFWD